MEYSVLGRVKQLVSLLKQHGISHIVLSPGNRNVPIVHSVENDPFFTCYNITDERSAAFFALGLINELQKPVAICCTSGTAVCNYVSAVSEAFYRKMPLLVITADRNPYYLNQNEDQMVPQSALLSPVCKKSVSLPIDEEEKDNSYSNRLLNEAFLALDHHGKGPVHINIPIEANLAVFEETEIPSVRKIERHDISDSWQSMADKLKSAKRVLVIYGQSAPATEKLKKDIESFARKYNCVIATDHISNLHCFGAVNTFSVSRFITADKFAEICPDIVITVNGNYVSYIRGLLKSNNKAFSHWLVSESGEVADPFHTLSDIFECSTEHFFKTFAKNGGEDIDNTYLAAWKALDEKVILPEFEYSDIYAVQRLMQNIPDHSILHLANSSSVRLAQHFPVKETVAVYCNRGTNGIDGSMSSFIGQAAISKKLSFLLIGDLSFFYDMNALWNRYVGSNVRILLNNNEGAGIFHFIIGEKKISTLNKNTAAEHFATAKGWVESVGFRYLCATNKEELDEAMREFTARESDKPIFLEVFTKKDEDAHVLSEFYGSKKQETLKDKLKKALGR